MGNDLKNFSNEIPCRSLERPTSSNPIQSLGSEQTPSSMKPSTFKARFDMALNKKSKSLPLTFIHSHLISKKRTPNLLCGAVTGLDFWPAGGHSSDIAGGGQWRVLKCKALEGTQGKDLYWCGFVFYFCFVFWEVLIWNSAIKQTLWPEATTVA